MVDSLLLALFPTLKFTRVINRDNDDCREINGVKGMFFPRTWYGSNGPDSLSYILYDRRRATTLAALLYGGHGGHCLGT